MRKCSLVLVSLIAVLCLAFEGCSFFDGKSEYLERNIFALDTYINLKVYGDIGEQSMEEAEDRIEELENLFSVTVDGSDICRINSSPDTPAKVSDDTVNVINTALEISSVTDGALDISVYPVVELWGFTRDTQAVPIRSDLDKALNNVDWTKIFVDDENNSVCLEPDMKLDLGAVAKGYIADQTAEFLKDAGAENAVLSFGGNIRTVGSKNGNNWQIGVKYPFTQDNFAILSVGEISIVTSSIDQRNFEEGGKLYHHIIDPATGYPADNGTVSVTVLCNDGAKADGLSTALFVMGKDKAEQLYQSVGGFEYVILDENNEVFVTDGLRETFSLTENYGNINVNFVSRK